MNSPEFKNTVCRVCLDEGELFDWGNLLEGHEEITYKDCYYKYTQIMPLDDEHFSTVLCQNCVQGLQSIHEFVLKALDSYNFLLEVNGANSEMDGTTITEEVEVYPSDEFETVLVEKTDTESLIEDQYELENSFEDFGYTDEEYCMTMSSSEKTETEDSKGEITTTITINKCENEDYEYDQLFETVFADIKESPDSKTTTSSKCKSNDAEDNDGDEIKNSKLEARKALIERLKKARGRKRKLKNSKTDSQNTPSMCSICSKILHNKYALQKHEKTHENRERNVPCPICGVKFFAQANVVTHMHIHDEKREKKHKCEFCEKDFYTKGSLNVHRRVHLGQMIPCTICEKKFFRKVDLDIHMNRHSAIAINGTAKKRSRYLVQCKHCNKQVLSTNYKSHTAAHLNQPLVKCLICDKEFYRRESCKDHLKVKHDKKSTDDWNKYIYNYDSKRLSHLLLEQTTNVVPTHK
ncbi:uncharacterized protein ACRADG_007703 [Cochliomyia hominivorax]